MGRYVARAKTSFALLAILVVAALVRIPSYQGHPLWIDELWRVVLILDPGFWRGYFLSPSVETAITAPLYALLVKTSALFRISPGTLRLSSLLPGLLCGPLAFAVIRKAGSSVSLALLAALVFALNPSFISYSDEMKPYMFEVCIHLAVLYAWLVMLMADPPISRDWLFGFAILILALLSSATVVFTLPAIGLSLFARFAIDRDLRNLKICIAGFVGLGVVVGALYFFIWRYGASGEMLTFWSNGFPPPHGNYLLFLAGQLHAMWHAALATFAALPGQALWALLVFTASLIWAVVTGAIGRRPMRDFAIFYVAMLVTLCVLNLLRLWPLGADRENLFLYGHMIACLFLFWSCLPLSRGLARFILAVAILSVVWPLHSAPGRERFRIQQDQLAHWGPPVERSDLVIEDFSASGPVGKSISADCPSHKTVIVLDGYMTTAMQYYTEFDSAHRRDAALLTSNCVRLVNFHEADLDPNGTAKILSQALAGVPEAWFLYTHQDPSSLAALSQTVQRFGQIAQTKNYQSAGYFRLVRK